MKIIDLYKNIKTSIAKEIRVFNSAEVANLENAPLLPSWFWTAELGMPRQANIPEIRQYAKSCWVQMVINAICKQIMTTDWDIVSTDEEDETDYSEQIEKIKTFLQYPNQNGDTFWDVWIPFLRDVLEIDAGVIYKARNNGGELKELYPHDASRFLYKITPNGIKEGFYQYSYLYPKSRPIYFENDEIIYGKVNTSTELFPYGFSPLQSIQQIAEIMIQADRYNKEFFKNNAVPDGIVSSEMEAENLKRMKQLWEKEAKGKAHKLMFMNAQTNFTPLALNNRDMQWLEGQKWYFHLVFGAYGLSPQEVGFYENSNKSTGESQERITIKNAIKPYLTLIEHKINREIIPEIVGHDEIEFRWFTQDDASEKIEHDQTMAKLNASVLTINEVRAREGLEPVEWGDQPIGMVMQDRMAERGAFEDKKEEPKDRDDKKEERDKEKKDKTISKEIDAGEDMVEQATSYEDFLETKFGKWEKKILSFVDETLSDEVEKDVQYMDKTFGEFLTRLFNVVNTSGFITALKGVVKAELKTGINDAETELKVDVGFTPGFDQEVKSLADRQLEGFYIEGKRWKGIKGVADDVQKQVSQIVRDGIVEKQSVKDISKEIKEYMGTTKNRATMIARTETNRFHNHAKIKTYQESGLSGHKVWDAFHDNRTSEICNELDGQKVGLNEPFRTEDGKEYVIPPGHPNCRSVVRFELD